MCAHLWPQRVNIYKTPDKKTETSKVIIIHSLWIHPSVYHPYHVSLSGSQGAPACPSSLGERQGPPWTSHSWSQGHMATDHHLHIHPLLRKFRFTIFYFFILWEGAKVPDENVDMHRENMQSPHRPCCTTGPPLFGNHSTQFSTIHQMFICDVLDPFFAGDFLNISILYMAIILEIQ